MQNGQTNGPAEKTDVAKAELYDELRWRQSEFVHDEISNMLQTISHLADLARENPSAIDEIKKLTNRTQKAVRQIETYFRPMDRLSFPEGVAHAERVAGAYGKDLSVAVSGDPSRLEPETRNDVLRTLRELIQNACKHGDSPVEASVKIGPAVSITVTDEGNGFDLEEGDLWYVQARTKRHGGTLSVSSAGKTRVEVKFEANF